MPLANSLNHDRVGYYAPTLESGGDPACCLEHQQISLARWARLCELLALWAETQQRRSARLSKTFATGCCDCDLIGLIALRSKPAPWNQYCLDFNHLQVCGVYAAHPNAGGTRILFLDLRDDSIVDRLPDNPD